MRTNKQVCLTMLPRAMWHEEEKQTLNSVFYCATKTLIYWAVYDKWREMLLFLTNARLKKDFWFGGRKKEKKMY